MATKKRKAKKRTRHTYTYRGAKSDRPWTAARKAAFDRGFNQAVYPVRHKVLRAGQKANWFAKKVAAGIRGGLNFKQAVKKAKRTRGR